MIKLININKYYNSSEGKFHALTDINLTLPDQGMVYVTGKSGSGKSTLLNIIGGIDNYDSGQMIIENNICDENNNQSTQIIDTTNFTKKSYNAYRNSYIGFIFQEFNVIKGLTVYENICLSLELQKKSPRKYHQEILNIIEKVGLKGKEKRRINELSGGERQRVAIARALIKDPKIIIADEPTGNLDSKNRDIIMDILKDLSKEKLVLIVTHDRFLASRYGDREISIKDGKIINDQILHSENVNDIVYTNHEIKAISPKFSVPLRISLIGFKLNIFRFILIIILFSISLIFAGTVFNLYLTNTTKEYASFQKDYGNYAIDLNNNYNYLGINRQTGFFGFRLEDLKKNFSSSSNHGMTPFTSFHFSENINKNGENLNGTVKVYTETIDNIIIYENKNEFENNFELLSPAITSSSSYKCYITDYLADCLLQYQYFGTDAFTKDDLLGYRLNITGIKTGPTIIGIIKTNYQSFIFNDNFYNDLKLQVAFQDNLAFYNALYMSNTDFLNLYSENNVNYYYDDIIFNLNNNLKEFNNVKITTINRYSNKLLEKDDKEYGHYPEKPLPGAVNQVAVSKGFVEQVIGLNIDDSQLENMLLNQPMQLAGSYEPTNFYICGTRHTPMELEFLISGIIDDYYVDDNGVKHDNVCIYTPEITVHTLYKGILSSIVDGGYLTIKISDDINVNSEVYRNLLNQGIKINNSSFIKLQLVDDFINDNLFLFAVLFFAFALFSILMIFNFVVINIKNSTRDIGIYMSLGMNGFKISCIYLFQVLIISTISVIIGLVGSTVFLKVMDANFSAQALIDFAILKDTFIGISGVILLGYLTPLIAIISPLLSLSKKKPVDVIKQS